jgi:uncharacterized protein YigE (DUF2233 family)
MDEVKGEDLLEFIKAHRSNEANFSAIKQKLEKALQAAPAGSDYQAALKDVQEKQLPAYLQAKESEGQAWPEFEKLVAAFERSVVESMKEKERQ